MMQFEWDDRKERINRQKHGIEFSEAVSVFLDEEARIIDDPDHSDDSEARFILLGMSEKARVLTVVHCYRENDKLIRIISARRATKNEIKLYGEFQL